MVVAPRWVVMIIPRELGSAELQRVCLYLEQTLRSANPSVMVSRSEHKFDDHTEKAAKNRAQKAGLY
jgi:hypothetical protein